MNTTTLESVLKRYNYQLEKQGDVFTFRSAKDAKSETKIFYYFSIFALICAIASIFFFSIYITIFLLISTVPLFLKAIKVNDIENTEANKVVHISKDVIKIKNKNNAYELELSEVKSINHNFERDKDISIGELGVIMDNDEFYGLFKFMGHERRYIEDDTIKVANELTELLNSE